MPRRKHYVAKIGGRHWLQRLETEYGEVMGYAEAIIDITGTATFAEGDTNVAFETPVPDNAVILDGVIDVVTAFTAETSDTGVTMALKLVGTADILAATANSSLGVGLVDVVPDGAATNMVKTAAIMKNLVVTIDDPDGTNGMNAGKAIVWLRFVVTE